MSNELNVLYFGGLSNQHEEETPWKAEITRRIIHWLVKEVEVL